jgi:hypothetical protein
MIYLEFGIGGYKKVLILEHRNLDCLREGGMVTSPATSPGAASVVLLATHDALWLSDEVAAAARAGVLNPELLMTLLEESNKRPIVNDRPYHGEVPIIVNGKPVQEAS